MRTQIPFGDLPIGADFQRANGGTWWRKVEPAEVFSHLRGAMVLNCESCGPKGQVTAGEVADNTLVWVKVESDD